jgi:mRNA interferase MazF
MVKPRAYVPRCGDIVWITLNPQTGHEQAGRRPALVLSPHDYNIKTSLAILCPITSQVKGYPFEIVLPEHVPITGAILSDQVKSLDWHARKVELICRIPAGIVSQVVQRLRPLLPQ